MGDSSAGMVTLEDRDREVLDVLADGRANPKYIRNNTELDKGEINTVLVRLGRSGHVEQLTRGLYEITDKGRRAIGEQVDGSEDVDELRGRLQDALEARDDQRARADRLEDELADCREQLGRARDGGVDVEALRHALNDIETAAEQGEGKVLKRALSRAREAIADDS